MIKTLHREVSVPTPSLGVRIHGCKQSQLTSLRQKFHFFSVTVYRSGMSDFSQAVSVVSESPAVNMITLGSVEIPVNIETCSNFGTIGKRCMQRVCRYITLKGYLTIVVFKYRTCFSCNHAVYLNKVKYRYTDAVIAKIQFMSLFNYYRFGITTQMLQVT